MEHTKHDSFAKDRYTDERYHSPEYSLLADYDNYDTVEISMILAISLCSGIAVMIAWYFS